MHQRELMEAHSNDTNPESADAHHDEQHDRGAMPAQAEPPPRLPFPVIGIGASAGGLTAITEFLSRVRPDSGMAFVFIQHLPPTGDSMLAEILSKRTSLPVFQVENGMEVAPNHLYVIRPGHTLTIGDGVFHLGERLATPMHNRPVDDFFKSLAQEQRERAICVVMSGMGSNGSAGAQAIKAVGGLCVAQDPETAEFPSMPRHLIDAGYADYVLPLEDIPDVLLSYAGHPYAQGKIDMKAAIAKRDQQHVREILAVLRTRTRHDFNGYKKPTVLRRIHRRMGMNRVTELGEYAKVLRQSTSEVTSLADDLLIHVTGFFRDPEMWEALRQQVIVPLIGAREPEGSIRCWATACSSGEEAYTLAMLLVEEAERVNKPLDIKVFATDMAERTLQNARMGVYPGGIESDIQPQRLERFFQREEAVFRVRQELRERVIFAPQNVLQDPPFSRLDIVTCRNLLIYLEPEMQQRILGLLHFGLREGGTLFLGTSETTAGSDDLFESVDKKARIYRRLGPTRHGAIEFPLPHAVGGNGNGNVRAAADPRGGGGTVLRPSMAQMSSRALLEHHTPPAVTIDRDHRIVYYHGDTEPFIASPRGEPTRELMLLVRENVRGAVRTALHRAASGESVTVPDGWIETEPGRRVRIAVTASPLDAKNAPDFIVVSFHERGDEPVEDRASPPPNDTSDDLRRAREELQSTVEELQTSNEELKASHEEVVSTNEELQSSNEELETSREEMQSLNEELSTVNSQLHAKIAEHQAAHNDLASLLTSTHIAVLFLDTHFRIRRYTPEVRELFEMIASDVGRPLSDLAKKFTDPYLEVDAEKVLASLAPSEREVEAEHGRWFLRRLTPYRTADNRIDGVVVSFVDISARLKAETALRFSEEQLRIQHERAVEILESISDAFYAVDSDFNFTYVNGKAEELWGRRREDLIGKHYWTEFPDAVGSEPYRMHLKVMEERRSVQFETLWPILNQWIDVSIYPEASGGLSCYMREITERKQAEESLRASEERFRLLVEGACDFAMILVDPTGRITTWNDGAQRLLGYSESEAVGQDAVIIFTPEDRSSGAAEREMAQASTGGKTQDERWHLRKDGTRFWGTGVTTALRQEDGSIRGFVKVLRDETDRKQSEAALYSSKAAAEEASRIKDEFLAILSHELRTPLSAVLLWAKMLSDRPAGDDEQLREGLRAIRSSAEAQKELIEDLLDVSRIASGQLRMQMREIDLLPVARDAVEAIAPTAEAKGVKLTADFSSKAATVRADPNRLRQILWNLLTNAVKFTPAKGRVEVGVRRIKGEIEITVSDSGRGIGPEFLPHVFERFRQADPSSTRIQGGMGLGLSIAKQLVELHGGTISAQSQGPNKGATFIVRLPASNEVERPPGKSPRSKAAARDKPADLSGLSVLLVEDDRETRNAIAVLLRNAGMKVSEAESAAAALKSFRRSRPDLIVSDIGLPGEDGYAMIRRIRMEESAAGKGSIPAVALTAFARESDRNSAIEAGFQLHVSKPVEPEQILSALRNVITTGR